MKKLAIAALIAAATMPPAWAQDRAEDADVSETAGDETGMSAEGEAEEEDSGPTYNKYQMATLRALDKITGRSMDFEIEVGEPVVFGALKVDLKVCYQTPPEEPPESASFLQIMTSHAALSNSVTEPIRASELRKQAGAAEREDAAEEQEETLFSGWMFASSPGLSALEHPVYDVWVIRCKQPSPESLSSPATPDE